MKGIIYLAIPFTHPYKEVEMERLSIVNKLAAELMMEGKIVFSPVSHSYEIANENNLPTDWNFWKDFCESFLIHCQELYVIKIDGWKESKGVQQEIKVAKEQNIPIKYITV